MGVGSRAGAVPGARGIVDARGARDIGGRAEMRINKYVDGNAARMMGVQVKIVIVGRCQA